MPLTGSYANCANILVDNDIPNVVLNADLIPQYLLMDKRVQGERHIFQAFFAAYNIYILGKLLPSLEDLSAMWTVELFLVPLV